jgi:hypothetical protein
MKDSTLVIAEVAIRLGAALIKIGSRKLLPLLAEKLDTPEILELEEILGIEEIKRVVLEALDQRSVQSR